MTEHGPQGGDEINTLLESEFNQYVNFGWPVASYGKVKYNVIEELNMKTMQKMVLKNLHIGIKIDSTKCYNKCRRIF